MMTTKKWPNEQQRASDFFWTRNIARPTAETWPYRYPTLEEAQSLWDAAAEKVAVHESRMVEMRAEREANARQQRDAAHAPFLARQEAVATAREEELRAIYAAGGGTEAGWSAEKDDILKADRLQRTLQGETPLRSLIGPREMVAG